LHVNDRETQVHELFAPLWRFFSARADADVDDLVQQTFTEYFESAGKAGPIRHPRAYALRVARSVLFRHYRRRGEFDPIVQTIADTTRGLSSKLDRNDKAGRVQEALRRLPYDLFEVIDLYYGEGLRGPVLAEALGVPEGTVRSRLRRARTQLREAARVVS
jgi:RNA polymerase sigma factor (sigma-70 family)